MSIKVYKAYRMRPRVDPFDLLWEIKRRGQAEAKSRLAALYQDIVVGRAQQAAEKNQALEAAFQAWLETQPKSPNDRVMSMYSRWLQEACPKHLKQRVQSKIAITHAEIFTDLGRHEKAQDGCEASLYEIDTWVHKKYKDQLSSTERNPWHLDVSLTLRRYRRRFYLLPYCDEASLMKGTLDFLDQHEDLEEFGYWNNTDPPEDVTPSQWAWRAEVWNALTETDRWAEYVSLDIVCWQGWMECSPMFDLILR